MMDLPTYILLSVMYLITIFMALSTRIEFHFWLAVALFTFGGLIGAAVDSYITGFVFAMVMHFIMWNGIE